MAIIGKPMVRETQPTSTKRFASTPLPQVPVAFWKWKGPISARKFREAIDMTPGWPAMLSELVLIVVRVGYLLQVGKWLRVGHDNNMLISF